MSADQDEAGNLPLSVCTFIGRDHEVKALRRLLAETRMVTLHGPGGVGKTELAMYLGAEIAAEQPGGVWFADLTAVTEPSSLPAMVADLVRLRDQSARPRLSSLIEFFADRTAVLVLDNCEHVADAVAELAVELLARTSNLRLIATSRTAPLHVPGERLHQVDPLPVPADGTALDAVLANESVRMLADRAMAATPAFAVSDDNVSDVIRLVRALDGLPLAITLAAARLRTLTVNQLIVRLDRAFRVLRGDGRTVAPHHRTLEAVIDWSYGLCAQDERLVWERCAVFQAGFDLDAADAVCGYGVIDRDRVIDLIDGLVQKSILAVDGDGQVARYRMLETTRQYAAAKLDERGEADTVRERHLRHYHALASRGADLWFAPGHRELDWQFRVIAELPNLRAAMWHAHQAGGERAVTGLRIALSLARMRLWFFRGPIREGYTWLLRLVDALPASAPAELRANAIAEACWIAVCMGDKDNAARLIVECRRLAPDDPRVIYVDGSYRMTVDADPTSVAMLGRSRELLLAAGRDGDAHMAGMMQGVAAALFSGRAEARAIGMALYDLARERQAAWSWTWARWLVAMIDLRHGRADRAVALFRESLAEQRAMDERWGMVWNAHGIAWALTACRDFASAATILGFARTLRAATGVQIMHLASFSKIQTDAEQACLRALGVEAYRTAFDAGAALSLAAGHALALGESIVDTPEPDDVWSPLTAREREVAELAAEGLSNGEIALRLEIGVRTVETHIRRLLPKLGLRRRAHLVRWVVDHTRVG